MASAPRETPDVALLACRDYDRGLVEEKVGRAFELLGGPGAFVGAGETVFVKNMYGAVPGILMKAYGSVMSVRPYPNPARCTGCGKCALICPAGAVTVRDSTASIDRSLCIDCFCCQELCEYDGIDLKTPLAARARRLSR